MPAGPTVTATMGANLDDPIEIPMLGAYAQPLPFMVYLMESESNHWGENNWGAPLATPSSTEAAAVHPNTQQLPHAPWSHPMGPVVCRARARRFASLGGERGSTRCLGSAPRAPHPTKRKNPGSLAGCENLKGNQPEW